jgi:hypothetical protein
VRLLRATISPRAKPDDSQPADPSESPDQTRHQAALLDRHPEDQGLMSAYTTRRHHDSSAAGRFEIPES